MLKTLIQEGFMLELINKDKLLQKHKHMKMKPHIKERFMLLQINNYTK